MGILQDALVESVYHYTPLHYLPFITRTKTLLCKPSLAAAGFSPQHFRTKSKIQDIARGFGAYTHLTLDAKPNILKAKLGSGFPHVQLVVPVAVVDSVEYSLCRYNVAMTRYLRRATTPGFAESPTNGRYYGDHQIPIAKLDSDKRAMLRQHLAANTMIEVLVTGDLILTNETKLVCFSEADALLAQKVIDVTESGWNVGHATRPDLPYPRNEKYAQKVEEFILQALEDPHWKGNGLEFDRV